MIVIKLAKHYQEDIATHDLPLPQLVESDGFFILKFLTQKDYFLYSLQLIDIRDRLEFDLIIKSNIKKLPKLVFCKKLIRSIENQKYSLN